LPRGGLRVVVDIARLSAGCGSLTLIESVVAYNGPGRDAPIVDTYRKYPPSQKRTR